MKKEMTDEKINEILGMVSNRLKTILEETGDIPIKLSFSSLYTIREKCKEAKKLSDTVIQIRTQKRGK